MKLGRDATRSQEAKLPRSHVPNSSPHQCGKQCGSRFDARWLMAFFCLGMRSTIYHSDSEVPVRNKPARDNPLRKEKGKFTCLSEMVE